jgi:hypothetical protein
LGGRKTGKPISVKSVGLPGVRIEFAVSRAGDFDRQQKPHAAYTVVFNHAVICDFPVGSDVEFHRARQLAAAQNPDFVFARIFVEKKAVAKSAVRVAVFSKIGKEIQISDIFLFEIIQIRTSRKIVGTRINRKSPFNKIDNLENKIAHKLNFPAIFGA